ncbi:hypothetical protein [Azospirillum himalayense]|uniref:Uncharacterized protein n=1 Tax=Azospirillum himalayense TaxID=654847 RepID=A0ABW0G4J4_9PROT
MSEITFEDIVHAELAALRELSMALLLMQARRSTDARADLSEMLDLIEQRMGAYQPPRCSERRAEYIRQRAIAAVQSVMGEVRLSLDRPGPG